MNQKYDFVYGPVPSRRLGQSLGVSPIPAKTCNYSCVYCQIGRTTHFTNTRQDFFPPKKILREIEHATANLEFDYLTFVGEGEPTLNQSLGWLINAIKEFSDKPIAVITNGALLYDSKMRKELLQADVILPTLDATEQELFKKVNRPYRTLDIEKIIQGMMDFREDFTGEIWMEVMLVKDLNDGQKNIDQLELALEQMNCDRTYVNVPIRPPAETWVQIPPKKRVLEICKQLKADNIAHYEQVEGFHLDKTEDIEEQLLKITTRHPLREKQIIRMLELPKEKTLKILNKMVAERKIKKIRYNEETFWINAESKIKDAFTTSKQ
jgi:wyosine [tRNA(Phe)-imidazoG37] synthetase (radical SAM superfamily)